MLKEADISYAVENSIPSVKTVADKITTHAKDAAIAKIIHDLDEKYS